MHCYNLFVEMAGSFQKNKMHLLRNLKDKLKLSHFIAMICMAGFTYQVIELSQQYLSFQTKLISETNSQSLNMTEFPAITVCLDIFFNFTRIKSQFTNFSEEVKIKDVEMIDDQFVHAYTFLNKTEQNIKIQKVFEYSINFDKVIELSVESENSYESKTEDSIGYITSFYKDFNDYCLTIFSFNSSIPHFRQSFIETEKRIRVEVNLAPGHFEISLIQLIFSKEVLFRANFCKQK